MSLMLAANALDERLVFEWLMHRGLIRESDVVTGQVAVTPQHSRNANFRVDIGQGGYFVKQSERQEGPGQPSVRFEAEVLSLMERNAVFEPLRAFIPRLGVEALNANDGILITELVEGSTLRAGLQFPGSDMNSQTLADVGARLGKAISLLHGLAGSVLNEVLAELDSRGLVRRAVPWFLTVADATEAVDGSLGGQIRTIVQQHGLAEHLAGVTAEWNASSLVHGDIKGENIVLGESGPVLTDWETADVGDCDWDIAGLFHSCIALWVVSMPTDPGMDGATLSAHATIGPDTWGPLLQSFWTHYADGRGFRSDDRERLARVARFTAARLVQAAAEHSLEQLSPQALRLLQIARNTFDEPVEMLDELLGIPA